MLVYRIAKTKFSKDLSGEGARLFSGRWNHPFTSCVYTSECRALALLEYTVNVHMDDIPRGLSIMTIEIDEKDIATFGLSDLPGDWRESPAPASTRDFGTNLLNRSPQAILRLPSAVIPQEFNYVFNPLHIGAKQFKVLDVRDFVYDVRIKLG